MLIAAPSSLPTVKMILSPTPPPSQMDQTNPRIASLKAIFPDFDDALILSVLDTAGGDHDRAADVLLGMSDPSFIPPVPSPPPSDLSQPTPSYDDRLSQEALDEEFARRLALEEQENAARSWTRLEESPSYLMYQPYQGRRSSRSRRSQSLPQSQSQQGEGGRDTMTEFQEGFNRIAESGKRTFTSIMSKVRAKMQEFDTGSQSQPPDHASSSYYAPPQPYPAQAPTSVSSYPPVSGLRPVVEPPQPSYYDPNTRGYDLYADDEATLHTPSPLATAPPASALSYPAPTRAEDVEDVQLVDRESPVPPVAPEPEIRSSPSPPPSTSPARLSLSGVGAKGTGTGRGAQVDFSKLGLLPKRPISLVRPQSPPVSTTGAEAGTGAPRTVVVHSESPTESYNQEEPEFVENPFEDQT